MPENDEVCGADTLDAVTDEQLQALLLRWDVIIGALDAVGAEASAKGLAIARNDVAGLLEGWEILPI